jgi:ABC-type branched-subunit amino acid transport system substrate-binding protein
LPEGSAYDAFVASYAVAYPDDDVTGRSFTAHSYDAAWLLACGAAWAHYQEGGISGLNIARGLRQLSSGVARNLQSDEWPPLLNAFEAGESVDVVGASGELDYDPITGETSGPIELWQISANGSEFEVIGGR